MATENEAGLVVQGASGAVELSLKQVTDRVNLVHQILEKVMKKGTHYGTVPGCGDKSVLFKPGADLLAMTFRLVPQFSVERTDLPNGHREYNVSCTMYSPEGTMLGQGVGSASTMETKYRYRKDSSGNRIENEDIADVYNTVLKISKKRAHIDGTLTVTGAADIFTQDVIDDDETPRAPVTSPRATGSKKKETDKKPWQGDNTATDEVTGIIEKVLVKTSAKNAKKQWTRYGIVIDGISYGTFDAEIGEMLQGMTGEQMTLTFTDDGKYKTVVDMRDPAAAPKDETTKPEETGKEGAQDDLPLSDADGPFNE